MFFKLQLTGNALQGAPVAPLFAAREVRVVDVAPQAHGVRGTLQGQVRGPAPAEDCVLHVQGCVVGLLQNEHQRNTLFPRRDTFCSPSGSTNTTDCILPPAK